MKALSCVWQRSFRGHKSSFVPRQRWEVVAEEDQEGLKVMGGGQTRRGPP